MKTTYQNNYITVVVGEHSIVLFLEFLRSFSPNSTLNLKIIVITMQLLYT